MTPDSHGKLRRLDHASQNFLGEKSTLKHGTETIKYSHVIGSIEEQLRLMREAGIPIQILIGRRSPDQSSLYWGWPYGEDAWVRTLPMSYTSTLKRIAPLIDTLGIFYDMRNPLDEERLEEIDTLQPDHPPAAVCPRIVCSQRSTGDCPYTHRWNQRSTATVGQKMANRHGLVSITSPTRKRRLRLASNITSNPPTGEDADEYTADDSDADILKIEPSLHHLARRAAYEREGPVGNGSGVSTLRSW